MCRSVPQIVVSVTRMTASRAALTARRNRADKYTVSDVIPGNTFTEFFDHADRFVSNNQARRNRILASHNVQIGPTDRRERHANDCFTRAGAWLLYLLDADFLLAAKYVCFHFGLPYFTYRCECSQYFCCTCLAQLQKRFCLTVAGCSIDRSLCR